MITNNNMEFKSDTQQYVLTETYVYNACGDLSALISDQLSTNNGSAVKSVLQEVSDIVYENLNHYAFCPDSAKYDIATNEASNRAIQNAMVQQLYKFVNTGDVTSDGSGSADDVVSKRAVRILSNAGLYFLKVYDIPKEW